MLFSNCLVSLFFLALFYILKPFYDMLVPSNSGMFMCPCCHVFVVQFKYHVKLLELFKIRRYIKYPLLYPDYRSQSWKIDIRSYNRFMRYLAESILSPITDSSTDSNKTIHIKTTMGRLMPMDKYGDDYKAMSKDPQSCYKKTNMKPT